MESLPRTAYALRAAGLILLLSAGAGAALRAQNGDAEPKPRLLDEIVAKVNNEVITLTDLQDSLVRLERDVNAQITDPAQREQFLADQKTQLLKTMIFNKIMLQRADEIGMSANVDVEVAAFIEQIRVDNNIPDMATFERLLQQQGLSMSEYRRNIKESMTVQRLIEQFVYSKITLLTPEVEAYYQENLDKFTEPPEIELAEILLLSEGKDREELRQLAASIHERLEAGVSFAELAREHSDGPTAAAGGAIGKFKPGQLNEELERVAFGLDQGQYSDVLDRDIGFQIVNVVSKSEPVVKPMEDVRDEITNALYQIKAAPERETFMKELVEESYVFVAPKYAEQYDVKELIG